VGQWLAVELARAEAFSEVQVWYRVIAGVTRFVPRSVTVQSSLDGKQWTTLVSKATDVPKEGDPPDREPRVYPCRGKGKFVRLLFEDGAQPSKVYDVVEIVEVIIPAPPGWVAPVFSDGQSRKFVGAATLNPVLPGEGALTVEERNRDDDGELIVTLPGKPALRIRKPLGEIGTQAPVKLPNFAPDHFTKMLTSNEDVWGLAVLAKTGDPSSEKVAGFTYPYKYPHCYVGVKEGKVEPIVAWDGSVSYSETGAYLSFGVDGKRIPTRHAYDVYRGLADMYLPAPVYVYLDREHEVGWEEMVVCDEIDGHLYTFIRLRVRNYGRTPRKFELSVFPFVDYGTSKPRRLTFGNIRIDANFVYVRPGLNRTGFWLSETGVVRNDRIAYDLELAPGHEWQLMVKLNRDHAVGAPRQPFVDQVVPRSIFAVLAAQKEAWDGFLASGMQIETPEPKLNDIIRAATAHTFVDVDGDVVKGGAFNAYDMHYPLLTMRIVRYCLDWGYFDNARRYLQYLLREPKNPSDGGPKSLFSERGTSPVYDGGYYLQVLARYHQYTHDDGFIVNCLDEIERCVSYILNKRKTSLEGQPEDRPSRGLITGRTTGDLKHATYAYCNDAPCWRGLVEMSKVLAQVGQGTKAAEIAGEAESYRKDILASIQRTTIQSTTPPFVPIIVDTKAPYANLHLNSLVSYTNFRMYNHLLDSGILDEQTTRWVLDYRKIHGGELLGMIRWGDMVDNFLCEDVQWEKLRLERVREFLLNFYAYITYDLAPGVWTGYEEFCLDPMKGQDPPGRSNLMHRWWPRWATRMTHGYEQTRVNANIPELARFMVIQAERDRDLLWLGRAIPRHWLTQGKVTTVRSAPTRWGEISFQIASKVDSAQRIDVIIETPGAAWPRINLRLRHPRADRLTRVSLNGKPFTDFDARTETIHLPAGLAGKNRVEVYAQRR